MGSIFTSDITVGYDGLKPDLTINPATLFDYFQKAAVRHSDSLGYKLDYFIVEKKGFVLTDWHVVISKLPCCYDTITVKTWPTAVKKSLTERNFVVLDKKDNVIIRAISRWIFMDMENRRIIRLSPEIADDYHYDMAKAIENENYHDIRKEATDLSGTRHYIVTRRDIDTNLHVNNVKYIEWAMDDIPKDVFYNQNPIEIRVSYKKECSEGDPVTAELHKNKNGGYISIFSNSVTNNSYACITSDWR